MSYYGIPTPAHLLPHPMFNTSKKEIQRLKDKLKKTLAQRDKARDQRDKVKGDLLKIRKQRNESWEQHHETRKQHAETRERYHQQINLSNALAEQLTVATAELDRLKQAPLPVTIEVPPGYSWPTAVPPHFFADNLAVWHKEPTFVNEERFQQAYQRGMQSGHHIGRKKGSSTDLHIEWRLHTIFWAAEQGAKIPGDFVECGVNTGIFSLAICDYLNFNTLSKRFWLFDTYEGIPSDQISPGEADLGIVAGYNEYYSDCYDLVKENFSPWPKAMPVRGKVPESLSTVTIERVAYLSIDMNIVLPEIAAIKYFWPKLSSGACVVLDDYGWLAHTAQKEAFDAFALEVGVSILNLPTGQGLMIKPPGK